MTPDQIKTVTEVYRKFADSDNDETEWTNIDEHMSSLEWLGDNQLTIEAEVKYNEQKKGTPRCPANHSHEHCFIPVVIDAVTAILDLYKETKQLHPKNKYILQYYLALSQDGFIVF